MTFDPDADEAARKRLEASAGERLGLIAESFARLTGRALPTGAGGDLWSAEAGIVAHGIEADPTFFYGNRRALQLFELTAEQLVRMPSRLSAGPAERGERERLLDQVAQHGFIEDYAGLRVSRTGRRFRIEGATVWNLIDADGRKHGQAAVLPYWTRLD